MKGFHREIILKSSLFLNSLVYRNLILLINVNELMSLSLAIVSAPEPLLEWAKGRWGRGTDYQKEAVKGFLFCCVLFCFAMG